MYISLGVGVAVKEVGVILKLTVYPPPLPGPLSACQRYITALYYSL